MSKVVKFSGQMDAAVMKALNAFQKQSKQTKTSLFTEMAKLFLRSKQIRPEVMSAADQVIREDAELLKRLAK